jgi:hypothetical protein
VSCYMLDNECGEIICWLFDRSSVPEDLHPYSNRSEDTYYFPEEKQLHSYRIIVSTLIHSGR